MFQSVIHQQQSGRFGAGAGVSVLVHAGLVAAVLFVSRGVVEEELKPVPPEPVLTLVRQLPRGNPTPAPTQAVAQPQPRPKPKRLVQSSVIPPLPPPEVMPPPPAPVDTFVSNLPVVPNSDPDGADTGGDPTAEPGEGTTNIRTLEPEDEGTVVFDGDMQQPKLLSGAAIQYTREALEARVQGLLVAKCVIARTVRSHSTLALQGEAGAMQALRVQAGRRVPQLRTLRVRAPPTRGGWGR